MKCWRCGKKLKPNNVQILHLISGYLCQYVATIEPAIRVGLVFSGIFMMADIIDYKHKKNLYPDR